MVWQCGRMISVRFSDILDILTEANQINDICMVHSSNLDGHGNVVAGRAAAVCVTVGRVTAERAAGAGAGATGPVVPAWF